MMRVWKARLACSKQAAYLPLYGPRSWARFRHHEAYNISNLLLELDAIDSPYVRDYVAGAQVPPGTVDTRKSADSLVNFRRQLSRWLSPLTPPNIKTPSIVGAFEAMAYVETHTQTYMSEIPHYFDILSKSQTLPQVARTTMEICQTQAGCSFLGSISAGRCISELYDAILNDPAIGKAPQTLAEVILSINNISAFLQSKGFYISPVLCQQAITLAARNHYFPTAQRYLAMLMTEHDRWTKFLLGNGFMEAMDNTIRPIVKSTWEPSNGQNKTVFATTSGHRRTQHLSDALTILTGWQQDGVPVAGEQRKPSFQSVINLRGDERAYKHYVRVLGNSGASEALWYEWHNSDSASNFPGISLRTRTTLFVTSLLQTGDTGKALEILRKQALATNRSPDENALEEALFVDHHRRGQSFHEESFERTLNILQKSMRAGSILPELEDVLNVAWDETKQMHKTRERSQR